jgi:hypothetical protein
VILQSGLLESLPPDGNGAGHGPAGEGDGADPARRPDPPFLVIDEVGPPQRWRGPTPRFAQLSCLRRQRSR